MAQMRKQDWTPRIHDVWVLMKTVDDDSEVEVYLTEELAMRTMANEMMREIRRLTPEQQGIMMKLLAAGDFDRAAVYWAEYRNVSYSWNEHRIITEL